MGYLLLAIIFVGCLIYYFIEKNNHRNEQESNLIDVDKYIQDLLDGKARPLESIDLMLEKSELAWVEDICELRESRSNRVYSGSSVRVMRGFSVSSGEST